MARGWESKSVEAQIDSAEEARSAHTELRSEDLERKARMHRLLLSRKRVTDELRVCTHLRYRKILQAALSDLDAEIARME